jgi:hypothetical protein
MSTPHRPITSSLSSFSSSASNCSVRIGRQLKPCRAPSIGTPASSVATCGLVLTVLDRAFAHLLDLSIASASISARLEVRK